MERKWEGIALILFGILLCNADRTLNYTLLLHLPNFPFTVLGLGLGTGGLILALLPGGKSR